jgi:hypothetical protein
MKEYKVEGKLLNDSRWWSIGDFFDNIEEAKERIKQERDFDKFHTKHPENWEYRILVREVSNWEIM